MATTMVSPKALESPSMKDARMPEAPAGMTTRVVTSTGAAPRPRAASLMVFGTALRASSERDATVGRIMMPTTTAAEAALNASRRGKIP